MPPDGNQEAAAMAQSMASCGAAAPSTPPGRRRKHRRAAPGGGGKACRNMPLRRTATAWLSHCARPPHKNPQASSAAGGPKPQAARAAKTSTVQLKNAGASAGGRKRRALCSRAMLRAAMTAKNAYGRQMRSSNAACSATAACSRPGASTPIRGRAQNTPANTTTASVPASRTATARARPAIRGRSGPPSGKAAVPPRTRAAVKVMDNEPSPSSRRKT